MGNTHMRICTFSRRLFALLLVVFLIAPAAAFGATTSIASSKLNDAVIKSAQKYGAAAIEVAVIRNGAISDVSTYGYAVKKSKPLTYDNKIRVASISKVVLAMTIMSLQEEGILDVDADIGEYWGGKVQNPYYKDIPITMRSILSHTSSIALFGDSTSRRGSAVGQILKNGTAFSRTKPGFIGSWGYNNYGFAVLGLTAELAANETMNSAARRKLFEPLGIDAAFGAGDVEDKSLLATIYLSGGSTGLSIDQMLRSHGSVNPGDTGSVFPGGLTISAYDLAKLTCVLVNKGIYDGSRIISEESVELMETAVGKPGGEKFTQCLPLRLQNDIYSQDALYYHTGSAYGVYNLMCYNPETRNGVVVLTTGAVGSKDKFGIYKVCADIAEYVFDDYIRGAVSYEKNPESNIADICVYPCGFRRFYLPVRKGR